MKQIIAATFCCVILTPIFAAEPSCSKGDMTTGMTGMQKSLVENTGVTWVKDVYVCDMGHYKIAVPVAKNTKNIFVWTDKGAIFSAEKDIGVSIHGSGPNNQSPETAVNVQDRDKDGVFDQITYGVFDKNGNQILDIIDSQMDGEIDHKIKLNDQ